MKRCHKLTGSREELDDRPDRLNHPDPNPNLDLHLDLHLDLNSPTSRLETKRNESSETLWTQQQEL